MSSLGELGGVRTKRKKTRTMGECTGTGTMYTWNNKTRNRGNEEHVENSDENRNLKRGNTLKGEEGKKNKRDDTKK